MPTGTTPDPDSAARKRVIDRRADWRRAHWGLYVLPGMATLNAVLVLVGRFSPFPVFGAVLGVAGIVAHYCGGRATKVRSVLVLELGAVALAFAGFLLTSIVE
ncbi:hypothetical protein [Saccharopolyspora hattusasensis]|uniref:hypothetical protein n=1 Tax=Saccharopolyspora hattusasensis TaxID=1128679 RepID=UPI003D96AF6E